MEDFVQRVTGRFLLVLLAVALLGTGYAQAQTCAPAWVSTTAYVGNSQVSRNCSGMKNFVSQYWTQGNDPCTNTGPLGSGEEWFVGTACGGATPTATATSRATATPTSTTRATATARSRATATSTARPTPTATATTPPTATPTSGGAGCTAAWVSTQVYNANEIASRTCSGISRNYKAAYWTQNNDPCTNAAPNSEEWIPWTFCGGGDTGSGAILNVVTKAQYDQAFPSRNQFYTFNNFTAAANSIAAFGGTGDTNTKKREIAAAFANFHHETGGLWYIKEIAGGPYCGNWPETTPDCMVTCPASVSWYGRGPIQLSWPTNYCNASKWLFNDLRLLTNPNQVETDSAIAWKTAIWYWMSQTGPTAPQYPQLAGWPAESAHDAITTTDPSGKYGFGGTIRAINGALECAGGNGAQVTSRINLFNTMKGILGVTGTFGQDGC